MSLTRQEVNLRRLLAKCELMCKNKQKYVEKFPQYIETLGNMLEEVKQLLGNPQSESISEYERRIFALRSQLGMLSQEEEEGPKLSPREELLGLRQRNAGQKAPEDLNEIIEHQQKMQDKIAEEMLVLTQNLRGQSEIANKIIKKDTEVLGKSTLLTEQNFSKLKVESEKLEEHSKRAWKCWLWVMLVIVMVVFINMVLFMKVMKKN